MFDDDVCFADTSHEGASLKCSGGALLREALEACRRPRTIVGCGYVGRQDLSILEHARLGGTAGTPGHGLAPAFARADVHNVAPGGISTAFLAVSGQASELPDFPEHYNEDYLWLHWMAQRGWTLSRTRERLVHAPPGGVVVTAAGLGFQIFGEIVWLAVLERQKYPFDDRAAMAAAVEEIVSDLRTALRAPAVKADAVIRRVISSVKLSYETVRDELAAGASTPRTDALLSAIARGLRHGGDLPVRFETADSAHLTVA